MRIAICDDSQEDIEYLKKLIIESKFLENKVEFYEFYTGKQLLENFNRFELIFLDIKLNGISGIRVAEAIRLRDSIVPIVFYTNYDVLASKVVKTYPIHYLIKGSRIEEAKAIIDNVLHRVFKQEESKGLSVIYAGKMFMLSLSDILYISILDKGTAIWLRDERRLEIFGELKKNQNPLDLTIKSGVKLETYYEQLKNYGFIYAKKSYIINIRFIVGRNKDSVLLKDGVELTVARSKKKQFDDQLAEYWLNDLTGGQ